MSIRRINWSLGDSSPISANAIINVSGSGTQKIVVGFPVSAAHVSFSKQYIQDNFTYNPNEAPEVSVTDLDDTGFTIEYKNIPDRLEINYYAE